MEKPARDIILLEQVSYHWPGARSFGLKIEQFALNRAETMLLLGESGSGKSTLLSLICATLQPQSGRILVNGTDLIRLRGAARDRFRAENTGIIFQQFNLLPFASVMDNIRLPLLFAGERRNKAGDAAIEARKLCQALGLDDGLLSTKAGSLSVGQQQRVAAARALIGSPPLIIADEPTSALDEGTQKAFLDLLFEQVRATGSSLLMVSHDKRYADRFDKVTSMEQIASINKTVPA